MDWTADIEIIRECRRMVQRQEAKSVVNVRATNVEILLLTNSEEMNETSHDVLNRALTLILQENSFFLSVNVVWGTYLLRELPSDSPIYFVITELEGHDVPPGN
jgi:hypothetical protein